MIVLREFKAEDVLEIDKVYHKQPWNGIPSLRNVIINRTIEKDGVVVGYTSVKLFAVITLALDPDLSLKSRLETVLKVHDVSINAAKEAGIEKLYVSTGVKNFELFIKRRLHYEDCTHPFMQLDLGE